MSDDPYYEWLRIPTGARPPDYYALLGLQCFEADGERIRQAARDRMATVRKFSLGPKGATAIRILDEISQAFDCLSDPARKQEYDGTLVGYDLQVDPVEPESAHDFSADSVLQPVLPKHVTKSSSVRTAPLIAGGIVAMIVLVLAMLTYQVLATTPAAVHFAATSATQLQPGQPWICQLDWQASGKPRDAIRFSLESDHPPGIEIDALQGKLSWTPLISQKPGVYQVVVHATIEGTSKVIGETSIPITVASMGTPLRIAPVPPQTIVEGQPLSLQVQLARSGDIEQHCRFSLVEGAPDGLTIESHSGRLSWTPSEMQGPGKYEVTVVAIDTGSVSVQAKQAIVIRVEEANQPPAIEKIAHRKIELGQLLRCKLRVTDPDLPVDNVDLTLEPGAPPGLALDSVNRTIVWSPTWQQAGKEYQFNVRATDNGSPSASCLQSISVTVAPIPREFSNSVAMKLVFLASGEFLMGASTNEEGSKKTELPQHRVRISEPFYLGAYEVSQAEFARVMGVRPSWFTRNGGGRDMVTDNETEQLPVEQVSWEEAVEFCRRLGGFEDERKQRRKYRLPTEAEWEFACRGAEADMPYSFGTELTPEQANFKVDPKNGKSLNCTAKIASYKENSRGLFDLHGNVCEWCADWYAPYHAGFEIQVDPLGPKTGTFRVFRGGSWRMGATECRSAARGRSGPEAKLYDCGFRVLCQLEAFQDSATRNSSGFQSTEKQTSPRTSESRGQLRNVYRVDFNFSEDSAIKPLMVPNAKIYHESFASHVSYWGQPFSVNGPR